LSFLSDSLLFFSKKKASRRERESQKLNFVMVSDSFFLKEKDKSLFLFVCPKIVYGTYHGAFKLLDFSLNFKSILYNKVLNQLLIFK